MSDTWDGKPQNPERDGWHWCKTAFSTHPREWISRTQQWAQRWASWDVITYKYLVYLEPVLTPAEVAAREAAAYQRGQEDMRERAAQAVKQAGHSGRNTGSWAAAYIRMANAIRALPIQEAPHE